MRAHFEPMPVIEWEEVEQLDDLTPAIELYVSLVRLGRFEEALHVFRDQLGPATYYRLGASRQLVELLEMVFPDGIEQTPRLLQVPDQASALNMIALGCELVGRLDRAVLCFRRSIALYERQGNIELLAKVVCNLAEALLAMGAIHTAEASAFRALNLARADARPFAENISLKAIGLAGATRGRADRRRALHRSLALRRDMSYLDGLGRINASLAKSALWRGEAALAGLLADCAWEFAGIARHESDFINASRLQGEAALALGNLTLADERLHHALSRARTINHMEHEVGSVTALASLHLRRGEIARGREHLDGVWDAAARGPYRLLHADARNALAEIEVHEGHRDAAIAAATAAYKLAWCDGPPFAYDYGLRTARAHLQALSAPEPELPPYDASKHEPIDEIPIELEGEQRV
jgi:tetratricopeptide (TPR) repeat protein